MPIILSFSTINSCLQPNNSHNWLNKQMGLKPEERPWWKEGQEAHAIIQDHVSGKKENPNLAHVKFKFPIVEEKDFDERCKFSFNFSAKYSVIGFYDGLDLENNRFLEIKASDPLWSVGKFQKSMQRKLYALGRKDLKEAILITCSKKPDRWAKESPKVFKAPLTDQDREEASEWIAKAIELLEAGDFTGGLEGSVCTDPYCYFGCNCSFK